MALSSGEWTCRNVVARVSGCLGSVAPVADHERYRKLRQLPTEIDDPECGGLINTHNLTVNPSGRVVP
jgi:hypothetical protein